MRRIKIFFYLVSAILVLSSCSNTKTNDIDNAQSYSDFIINNHKPSISEFCDKNCYDGYFVNALTNLDYIVYNKSYIAKVYLYDDTLAVSTNVSLQAISSVKVVQITPSFSSKIIIVDKTGNAVEFYLDAQSAEALCSYICKNTKINC